MCFTVSVAHVCRLGFAFLLLLAQELWYILTTPVWRKEREMLAACNVGMFTRQDHVQWADCCLLTGCPNNAYSPHLENCRKVQGRFLTGNITLHSDGAAHCSSLFQFAMSPAPHVLVHCITVTTVLGFYQLYLKNVLKIFSFGSQTRFTSNAHVVHCTLKFPQLSQPIGRDWRQLSDKIMSLYCTGLFLTERPYRTCCVPRCAAFCWFWKQNNGKATDCNEEKGHMVVCMWWFVHGAVIKCCVSCLYKNQYTKCWWQENTSKNVHKRQEN
jgi:hypothetical protein